MDLPAQAVEQRKQAAEGLLQAVQENEFGLERGLKAVFKPEALGEVWWFIVDRFEGGNDV